MLDIQGSNYHDWNNWPFLTIFFQWMGLSKFAPRIEKKYVIFQEIKLSK
jgi:hypothetical protein